MRIDAQVPRAFVPLLGPARYKGAFGGRGSAKSHFFAERLILRGFERPTRAACIREVQQTIRDSVRQLLIDKIQKFDLGSFYDVKRDFIRAPNGSYIIFKGMQTYNADNVKSLEDFDIAWAEEAQNLSKTSLRLLRPTIRKDGSEIWASWNPRYDDDAIDEFFRKEASKRRGMVSVSVGWKDNPWFPKTLREEMEDDYVVDPEMASHVWGGDYLIITEGAYYAKHVAAAERGGRVGFFPYNPDLPVMTAWDIGVDDYTAIWFIQVNGREITCIDYYETSGDGADEIVAASLPELNPEPTKRDLALEELDREVPFVYGKHYLPHDVMVREWGGGARTRYQTLQGLGVKPINVGAQQGASERINALRAIFPLIRFNDIPAVRKGIQRIRRYSRKFNDAMQTYTTPSHDDNSHGADALGEFAVNCGIKPPEKPKKSEPLKGELEQPLMKLIDVMGKKKSQPQYGVR